MDHLEIRLEEYVVGGRRLLLHRIAMYCGATALVALYFSVPIALICLGLLLATEAIDNAFVWNFNKSPRPLGARARQYYRYFFVSSALSTFAVSGYALIVAIEQGPGDHFMPMTFLLAAALFAAMNNHQIREILFFRLFFYGLTFLAIPARDLIILQPPLVSTYWLQMITALFILYFVVDLSLIFLRLYQARLAQLEELARENERTNAALSDKNSLISVVSHELKTPLTVVSGVLDILALKLDEAGSNGSASLLKRARQNSRRLHEIVNDMLDLRSIERGDFALIMEEFSLSTLVASAVQRHNELEQADRYHFFKATELQAAMVRADRARIERILDNLLSNAGKFSQPSSSISVHIRRFGKERVGVSVSDQGIGIAREEQDAVFQRFSQLDSGQNRSRGGLGLGLNLAREILLLHNGDLTVESELGKGSTFHLILPDLCNDDSNMKPIHVNS